jgi:hypothetical protein
MLETLWRSVCGVSVAVRKENHKKRQDGRCLRREQTGVHGDRDVILQPKTSDVKTGRDLFLSSSGSTITAGKI